MFHDSFFLFTSIPQAVESPDLYFDRVLPWRVPNVAPSSNSIDLSVDSTTTITTLCSQNLDSSCSSRVLKPYSYFKDFHCYSVSYNNVPTTHLLSHVLSYDHLSSNHKAFVYAISSHSKPITYSQDAKVPEWNEVMMAELKALQRNGTWTLTALLAGKLLVGYK